MCLAVPCQNINLLKSKMHLSVISSISFLRAFCHHVACFWERPKFCQRIKENVDFPDKGGISRGLRVQEFKVTSPAAPLYSHMHCEWESLLQTNNLGEVVSEWFITGFELVELSNDMQQQFHHTLISASGKQLGHSYSLKKMCKCILKAPMKKMNNKSSKLHLEIPSKILSYHYK